MVANQLNELSAPLPMIHLGLVRRVIRVYFIAHLLLAISTTFAFPPRIVAVLILLFLRRRWWVHDQMITSCKPEALSLGGVEVKIANKIDYMSHSVRFILVV
jgi:flagellar biosynthesis protein FliQ